MGFLSAGPALPAGPAPQVCASTVFQNECALGISGIVSGVLSVSGCPDTEAPAKSYQPETDAALLKRAAEDPTVPVQDVFLALRSLQKAKLPVRGLPCTPEISSFLQIMLGQWAVPNLFLPTSAAGGRVGAHHRWRRLLEIGVQCWYDPSAVH